MGISNSKLVILLGESSTGKTTICSKLIQKYHEEFECLIETTSRNMRSGEVDGYDYHYLKGGEQEFKELLERNEMITYTKYNTSMGTLYYGLHLNELEKLNKSGKTGLIVSNPVALRMLLNKKIEMELLGIKLIPIYITCDRRTRLINSLIRGDDIDSAYYRNISDIGQYTGIENDVKHKIINDRSESLDNILENIYSIVKSY